jgi:CarD family transcriptional regulator
MYQKGDLVVYGSTGVSAIEGVGNPDPRDRSGRQFYLLKPLYQDGVIYTPVEGGRVSMRPVMSAEDAHELIALIPELHPEILRERTLQLLSQRYQTLLQSGDCRVLLELTISVYRKRRQAEQQKRRLGMVDERYGRQAERLLFGELAVALGISIDEVPAYIFDRVPQSAFAM